MRALGGGVEGRRRRGLQGSVWGAVGQGINDHAEDVVGGAVRGSDRHVLASRIHCGGRDVEGGGCRLNVRSSVCFQQNRSEKGGCIMKLIQRMEFMSSANLNLLSAFFLSEQI